MRSYRIETVPHGKQRYETLGDYRTIRRPRWLPAFIWRLYAGRTDDLELVTVSDMGMPDYEFLIAIHEQVEQYLTERRGISEQSIMEFDLEFERNRKPGNVDEPGDDPKAPYYHEHQLATKVEKIIAADMGVRWERYEEVCASFPPIGGVKSGKLGWYTRVHMSLYRPWKHRWLRKLLYRPLYWTMNVLFGYVAHLCGRRRYHGFSHPWVNGGRKLEMDMYPEEE